MTEVVQECSPKRYSHSNLARTLEGTNHKQSHFVDIRGKGETFELMDFSYCVFIRAYFHNATFVNCNFVGTHFIDCNFRNAVLRDCDFSLPGSHVGPGHMLYLLRRAR